MTDSEYIASVLDGRLDQHKRTIRVALPMDATLFGEFARVICDRWPGTTVTGDGGHFILTLPPEKTPAGEGPEEEVVHDGQLHTLPKDGSVWVTDREWTVMWDAGAEAWKVSGGLYHEPPRLVRLVADEDLGKWITPNQFPLRRLGGQ